MAAVATILPNGMTQFIDANGVPLVGGKVYFYVPNTSTPKNTWQDAAQGVLNTNPVILDSNGQALIYGLGQYRQVVTDEDDNTIWDELTQDVLGLLYTQTNTSTGSSLIGVKVPVSTGVARQLYSKLLEIISVRDFGATGDGSTDDTAAINAAIAFIPSTGGVLFFPAGTYRITGALSISNRSITIVGEGEGVSIIKVDAAVDCINIVQNSEQYFTSIKNISLRTTQLNVGDAITIDYSAADTTGQTIQRCLISQVEIRGTGEKGTAGFENGIVTTDLTNSIIECCSFGGYKTANTPAGRTNAVSFIKLQGANSPVEMFISNCKAYVCQNGVEIIGTIEGVYIEQCAFVQVGRGIYWHQSSGNRPLLFVRGCHVNCFWYGIYGSQIGQVNITDNLIYESLVADATTVGIYFTEALQGIIKGNMLQNSGGFNDFKPIVLDTDATYFIVSNNSMRGAFTNGIEFKSGSANNIAIGNVINGTYTNSYLNNGTENAIGRRGVLAYVQNDQATANAVDHTVTFDAVSYDTDGFWGGAGTGTITIPLGSGIKKVRLSGDVTWQANAVGPRRVTISKNASGAYPGRAGSFTDSNGYVSPISLNVIGAIIDVSEGDIFRLVSGQDSGGSLNVLGSGRTYISLEVIE